MRAHRGVLRSSFMPASKPARLFATTSCNSGDTSLASPPSSPPPATAATSNPACRQTPTFDRSLHVRSLARSVLGRAERPSCATMRVRCRHDPPFVGGRAGGGLSDTYKHTGGGGNKKLKHENEPLVYILLSQWRRQSATYMRVQKAPWEHPIEKECQRADTYIHRSSGIKNAPVGGIRYGLAA